MKLFGLIGQSLDHSFSRTYFNTKFEAEHLSDCRYDNFSLKSITEFPSLVADHPELAGLNITIPYKESIIPFLDEIDPSAQEIGAVNTILFPEPGYTIGYNTDYIGFRKSLRSFVHDNQIKALILGTGGASKAVSYVFRKRRTPYLFVSREPVAAESIGYQDLSIDIMEQYKLIVNCTPLGTFPEVSQFPPIPFNNLTQEHFLFDLIYNPAETVFLKRGKEFGAQTKNGHEMLVFQAESSWSLWAGVGEISDHGV